MTRNRNSTQVNRNTSSPTVSSVRDFTRGYLRLSAVGLLAWLAGCAQLRWDKPGMDAASLERDDAECRQIARAQAAREAWPFGLTGTRVIVDPRGRVLLVEPYPRETDRFLREHELARGCMHGKGYALVPMDKTDAAREKRSTQDR